ncbi:MAG: sigma-70 family RNA polymerase sigma factor [Planctomycetaceae bacterium]|nr:sigma-70 family RNA polymerase sigma factor [Planctomycetaceae bacterium]
MTSAASSPSSSTSHTLLGRVKSRDPQAWQRFADIYTPLVYSWARRAGLQENDAADVVQEVFRTVARKLGDFGQDRSDPSFRGWLRTIARNECRLLYRRRANHPEVVGGSDAQQQLAELPGLDDEPTADGEAQDQHYLLHRTLKIIRDDFEESTWSAFWRLTVDGDPAAEIGEQLGLSPAAVRQAKFRVLCRLRQELQGM